MRNELQHIEKIEQYLIGELNELETAAFENEIAQNPTLAEQVSQQKLLQQAAFRKAIRADVLKYGGAGGFAWGKWMSILGGSVLLIGLIWYLTSITITDKTSEEKIQEPIINKQQITKGITLTGANVDLEVDSSLNVNDSIETSNSEVNLTTKNGSKNAPISYSEDTPCDGLKTWVTPNIQEFKVDPSKGKTIEGEDGTLIIVPTDAFVYDDGSLVQEEVKLELVEALKVSDMLAYNLTTMNDDKALQTGGMIYVQPYVNDKKVNINPDRPLYIEIPTDDYNPDMMAWQGETNAEGDINWVNPTPLKKYLTIVDFNNLNFLPTGFEDAVAAGMPFKGYTTADKALVDSLYYSIGSEPGRVPIDEIIETSPVVSDDSFSNLERQNVRMSLSEIMRLIFEKKFLKGKTTLIGFAQNQFGQVPNEADVYISQNGYINRKKIQTNKEGIFIFNKLEEGEYMVNIYAKNSDFGFSGILTAKGEDTIRIINPIVMQSNNSNITGKFKSTDFNMALNSGQELDELENCYISPQSIQTIKSPTFAKSFLATKEFEERLNILHQMPNAQALFDLYVNNLSKELHEVDAMVANKLSGDDKKFFSDFAAQRLTNVKDVNIYQDQLSAYYNKKKSEYSKAQQKAQKAYSIKSTQELRAYQQQLSNVVKEYNQLNNQQYLNSASNAGSVSTVIKSPRNSKLNISLPIVRNKLPNTKNVATSSNSYATPWYSAGWMNIDAYLHLISKNPKEVSIEIGQDKKPNRAKVYQFLNTLKTIIPITIMGTIGKAKFPKAGTQGASQMKNTYAIGIHRKDGKLFYAEERYNPYSLSKVDMLWSEVSEAMLMENLKKLDGTGPLVREIDAQQKLIAQQLKIQERKAELKVEMDSIQSKIDVIEKELAKENAFLNSLRKVVDKCGIESTPKLTTTAANTYDVVDSQPQFPGGQQLLYKFLAENITYPLEAKNKGIGGKVYVQFIVYEDGSINEVTVLKGVSPLIDNEAIRVVKSMPNWEPGLKLKKPVKVSFVLPIDFNLN